MRVFTPLFTFRYPPFSLYFFPVTRTRALEDVARTCDILKSHRLHLKLDCRDLNATIGLNNETKVIEIYNFR